MQTRNSCKTHQLLILASAISLGLWSYPTHQAMAGESTQQALPTINMAEDLTSGQKVMVENVADVLWMQCPAIKSYASDVQAINAKQLDAYPYQSDIGWVQQTEIEVVISGNPKQIPPEFYASGQHCYYSVGLDFNNPGIFTTKAACKKLCGLTKSDPDFIPLK